MNRLLSKYLFYYPVTTLRGELTWKYNKEYEASQWGDSDFIRTMQTESLKKLLHHSFSTVPYYHRLFKSNDITPEDIGGLSDLANIPITSKSDIVSNTEELRSTKKFLFVSEKTTGGSTGQAVSITKNADALARERTATWRGYQWAGVGIGDAQAKFWGIPLTKKRKFFYQAVDFISNRTRLSAFEVNQRSMEHYYQALKRLKPSYFYGYVSVIAEFARFVGERGYPPTPGLKCIITTSEVLDAGTRKLIESIFQTRVFNEYGCGEVGSIAHECKYGNMHIMAENLIVEIDTHDSPDQSTGKLFVTDLHNFAMPLIRYEVGDFATLANSSCECRRGLPLIEKIHGRTYDLIIDPDGTLLHPEVIMYIFEELKSQNAGIKQFQVIQISRDQLSITIVPEGNYDKSSEKVIQNRIQEKIHPRIKTDFKYSDHIDRENSGKIRIIKSSIAHR